MSPNKKVVFLGLGIISLVFSMVMGIALIDKYGPHQPLNTVPKEIVEGFNLTPQPSPTPTNSPTTTEATPEPDIAIVEVPTIIPTPTQEWMVYEDIDLREQQVELLISLQCKDEDIYIQPFTIIPWHPEVFENGQFAVTSNSAVAWEHLGIYGLWVHSGLDVWGNELTAYPLQNTLERNEGGLLHEFDGFDQALKTCSVGGEIRIKQDSVTSLNRVVAAVRVPSGDVPEVSEHVMDLVPYLAENYPGSGFDQMTAPGMLLYFCGRRLNGEKYNVNENYWTQSRIIIGFEPALDQD